MDRREFLKSMGAGALVTAAMAAGCDSPNKTSAEGFATGEVPTDKMTYRTGTHGEKVSLLGYGCMRLPSTEDGKDGNQTEGDLDQDRINHYKSAYSRRRGKWKGPYKRPWAVMLS